MGHDAESPEHFHGFKPTDRPTPAQQQFLDLNPDGIIAVEPEVEREYVMPRRVQAQVDVHAPPREPATGIMKKVSFDQGVKPPMQATPPTATPPLGGSLNVAAQPFLPGKASPQLPFQQPLQAPLPTATPTTISSTTPLLCIALRKRFPDSKARAIQKERSHLQWTRAGVRVCDLGGQPERLDPAIQPLSSRDSQGVDRQYQWRSPRGRDPVPGGRER